MIEKVNLCAQGASTTNTSSSSSITLENQNLVGITLAAFQKLVVDHGGRTAFVGKTTDWVKKNVVVPATLIAKESYATKLKRSETHCNEFVGIATRFFSHAYDYMFLDVLDAIAGYEKCSDGAESLSTSGLCITSSGGPRCFYYFDLLVVNQHGQGSVVPFEILRDEFGEGVRGIGHTLFFLRWDAPVSLNRAWCVFEIFTSLSVGAAFEVILSPHDEADFHVALSGERFREIVGKTCNVDVASASAREPADLANIMKLIGSTPEGLLRTNQLVIGAMRRWMLASGHAALQRLPVESRGASELQNGLARLCSDAGDVETAESLFRGALEALKSIVGGEHADTLVAGSNLAQVFISKGQYAEAESLLVAAYEVHNRTRGLGNQLTLTALNGLAVLYSLQGRDGEAEELMERGLAAARESLGPDSSTTLGLAHNLANALKRRGGAGERVEALQREVLSVRQRTLGASHPNTLEALLSLANALVQRGDGTAEAETLLAEALAARRRSLGDEHQSTLEATCDLASALQNRGKLEEAEALQREALGVRERRYGERHPATLKSLSGLAETLLAGGRHSEACALAERALAIARATYGPSNSTTINCICCLAGACASVGDHVDAEKLFREALEALLSAGYSEEHPSILICRKGVARELHCSGRLAEAEVLTSGVLGVQRRRLGDSHRDTIDSVSNLSWLLQCQGRLPEAETLCLEALAGRRRLFGNDHPSTQQSIFNLAFLLRAKGDLARSQAAFEESLEARSRLFGAKHPSTAISASHVGSLMFFRAQSGSVEAATKLEKAESLLSTALSTLKNALGPENQDAHFAEGHLMDLLLWRGAFDLAEPLIRARLRRCADRDAFSTSTAEMRHKLIIALRRSSPSGGDASARGPVASASEEGALEQEILLFERTVRLHREPHPHPLQKVIGVEGYPGIRARCDGCARSPLPVDHHCPACGFDLCDECLVHLEATVWRK